MTLTQQFLIISILPVSFIGMAIGTWRAKTRRRFVFTRWLLTLLLGAIWSSSVVQYFLGESTLGESIIGAWQIVGTYAFTLTIGGMLAAILAQLRSSVKQGQVTLGLTAVLLLVAIALDTRIWSYQIPTLILGGQLIDHQTLWYGTWVASWLIPLLAAIILTRRAYIGLPQSQFRNQLNYWTLVIFLFAIGSLLNASQPFGEQIALQQFGGLFAAFGAFVGTYAITRRYLPDLQLATRQLLSRLSSTLVIFGLTLLALVYLTQLLTQLPERVSGSSRNFAFLLLAGLFAAGFTLLYRGVLDISRRIFLPALARRERVMSEYANVVGNLPEPDQLGQLFLRIIQSNFGTDEVWLFEAIDAPGGGLLLRPLASQGEDAPETAVDFAHDDPVARHFRDNHSPLVQHDIDTLERFKAVPEMTRQRLSQWERVLFMPLHAGESLIGVLALGGKSSGASYRRQDFELLGQLSDQMSPLLAQAKNIASLRQINDYVFAQNQALAREKQYLGALTQLYRQYMELVSPDLRQSLGKVNQLANQLEESATAEARPLVKSLLEKQGELKRTVDALITLGARIDMPEALTLKPLPVNELVESGIRRLQTMLEARRIKVEANTEPGLPPVYGDEALLETAVYNLLHNAVKFNKIGGSVTVSCQVEDGDVAIRVSDSGVGLPEDRLASLWSGLENINLADGRNAGLGLPMTQFIVQAHGGRLAATTQYGSGSTFTIYLPFMMIQ